MYGAGGAQGSLGGAQLCVMTPPCHVLRCFIYTGNVAGLANKKEVKTKVAVDGLGRKGPGDPRWWHRAGECSWVTPPEPSDDDESSDRWPALELPRGRGRRP